FLGVAFAAVDGADLLRLATATGARTRPLPAAIGGMAVDLVDPGGVPVHVVAGMHSLGALPTQALHRYNMGHDFRRINATQRPRREPTTVQRLGHLVMQ
ncbi:2,3-dihydroxybiphenyl 1,2-dioxygenase, partial [Mycobacteroides abscessus subsp. massiliense]